MKVSSIIAILAAVGVAGPAAWASYSAQTEATNNGTIQPAGPRTGANGKNFFNMEGTGQGASFHSFGVADFNTASLAVPFTPTGVTQLSLSFTESNAAFTTPGWLNFWFAPDITTSIDPGSALHFIEGATPEGVDNQLGSPIYIGKGQFNTTGNVNNGQVDLYTFSAMAGLSQAAQNYILDRITGHGIIRVCVTPDEVDGSNMVAATFAGFSHSTYAGPTLGVTVTPEPSTAVAPLFVGLLSLLRLRRRR